MPSKRREIKENIKQMLIRKTRAGAQVYKGRFVPLGKENYLPAICIYIMLEDISEQDNLTQKRVAETAIECIVAGENQDDDLDILTDQIERLLNQDETLLGAVSRAEISRIEIAVDETNRDDIQAARLIYKCTYFEEAVTDPSVDSLTKIDVVYNNGDFEDLINFGGQSNEDKTNQGNPPDTPPGHQDPHPGRGH